MILQNAGAKVVKSTNNSSIVCMAKQVTLGNIGIKNFVNDSCMTAVYNDSNFFIIKYLGLVNMITKQKRKRKKQWLDKRSKMPCYGV